MLVLAPERQLTSASGATDFNRAVVYLLRFLIKVVLKLMPWCQYNVQIYIYTKRRTCELSCHFIDNECLHNLDRTSAKLYTSSLSEHITVTILEQVDMGNIELNAQDRLIICKQRENFWQNQLKTFKHFGGLNVREER